MTKQEANAYLSILAVKKGIYVYETNGERIFPIYVAVGKERLHIEDAYAYYLVDIHTKTRYSVQIFINANLTKSAFMEIFDAAIKEFNRRIKN